MNPHYGAVARRAAHHCEYCQAPEVIFNFGFEVEHIVPPNRGGNDHESNLALSCRSCNLHKSAHLDAVDPQTGNTVALFNPRRDRWQDHFVVEHAGGKLIGITPVGRATVERLQMNKATQISARKQWIRLKLFPAS